MPRVISILGITNTGKDTLAERMQQLYPEEIGLIQVGKEFRKRYPPEHFKGLGAMKSTEPEAWSIFDSLYKDLTNKQLIIVVSQPRMISQLHEFQKRCPNAHYYLLTCSEEEQRKRMLARFNNQKEGWLALAQERLINDRIQHYDLLVEMISMRLDIEEVYDTTDELDEVARLIYERENKWI